MRTAEEWNAYYTDSSFEKSFFYGKSDLGCSCGPDGTGFRLWSPPAQAVYLNLYRDGEGLPAFRQVAMEPGEKGVWKYETSEDLHGVYYDYEVVIDGERNRTGDPYAKGAGINGQRSMAVDLKRTDPSGWEKDRRPPRPVENIVYELHVKEFSWDASSGIPKEHRGTYRAFTYTDSTLNGDGIHPTCLSYLKNLGVTYVQLMPVFDYGSVDERKKDAFNWGYDPVNYNVPEGSYSTKPGDGTARIRELKEAVMALHSQGIRVVMDVVYNHTYHLDSWFQKTVPWYYYRTWEDGTVSDGSACGNDVASERAMCASYILDSVLYWAEEYHMDGFRFDLMGLLDTELMNRIRRELDKRYGQGEILLYGEPWAAGHTAMKSGAVPALKKNLCFLDANVGVFCDDTRNALKGSVIETEERGFINGGEDCEEGILWGAAAWCGPASGREFRAKAPSQIITYATSHDNQTLWDRITDTVPKDLWEKMNRLCAGIYLTCQGSLFLLSGEEFKRTKNGMDNSYCAPIGLNRLDWKLAWENRGLAEYYRGLFALRKKLPGLCDKTKDAWTRIRGAKKAPGLVSFFVDNEDENGSARWKTLFLVYNARKEAAPIVLPEAKWEVLADGENSRLWEDQEGGSGKVWPREQERGGKGGAGKAPGYGVLILGSRRQIDEMDIR